MDLKKTALHPFHEKLNAKFTDFSGWSMPVNYGSQIEEHNAVRSDCGVFDVSHMCAVEVVGNQACEFLQYLLANDIGKYQANQAMYSCMLNSQGGVVDDLIVYCVDKNNYILVINAGCVEKDISWLNKNKKDFDIDIKLLNQSSILAIQGPNAIEKTLSCLSEPFDQLISHIKPFHFLKQNDFIIARTGYTGEDGFEIILPNQAAILLWDKLIKSGMKPCGLAARDTLRLEAGLNLYGNDMDETVSPLEANLAWTIAWEPYDRDFIGRESLVKQKESKNHRILQGLILLDKGILRAHQKIYLDSECIGEITSGSFSPDLNISIAMARMNKKVEGEVRVEIRGRQIPARVVKPRFVRQGKSLIDPHILNQGVVHE